MKYRHSFLQVLAVVFLAGTQYGIVKLTLSERTYGVELTSFALIGRHRLPPARR